MTEGACSNELFELEFAAAGLTALKRVGDKYDTNYVVRSGELARATVRFRAGD